MENKEAIALIAKHWLANIDFITASVHAEIDLTNRIEMLERLNEKFEELDNMNLTVFSKLDHEIEFLKQQLEYLNNL